MWHIIAIVLVNFTLSSPGSIESVYYSTQTYPSQQECQDAWSATERDNLMTYLQHTRHQPFTLAQRCVVMGEDI